MAISFARRVRFLNKSKKSQGMKTRFSAGPNLVRKSCFQSLSRYLEEVGLVGDRKDH